MAGPTPNDNDRVHTRHADGDLDARGHAALLLAESLLHGLIARRLLSIGDAMEIVQTAVDVQRDMIAEMASDNMTMERSLAFLLTMSGSLDTDLPRN